MWWLAAAKEQVSVGVRELVLNFTVQWAHFPYFPAKANMWQSRQQNYRTCTELSRYSELGISIAMFENCNWVMYVVGRQGRDVILGSSKFPWVLDTKRRLCTLFDVKD